MNRPVEMCKFLTTEEIIQILEEGVVQSKCGVGIQCCAGMSVLAHRLQSEGSSSDECRMIEDFFAKVLLDPDCIYEGMCIQTWSLAYLLAYVSSETISVVSMFEDGEENAEAVYKARCYAGAEA